MWVIARGPADKRCPALALPSLPPRAAPLPPALGRAAPPLPHLCKHPPAGRENGPFVPSLAPVPQPSPSAAAQPRPPRALVWPLFLPGPAPRGRPGPPAPRGSGANGSHS